MAIIETLENVEVKIEGMKLFTHFKGKKEEPEKIIENM